MTLHVPKNKDAGSFSKAWQNNFWQITLTLQKNFDTLMQNFIGTSNDINSKRAFLPHDPWIFFELVASTAANSAVTITQKLGQRVIAFAVEELNVILANQVFLRRPVPGDRIKQGTNITITRRLGEIEIAATSGGSLQVKTLDGTVSDSAVTIIQQQNGALVDNGTGDVTLGWMEPLVDTSVPEILFDGTTGDILMVGVTS